MSLESSAKQGILALDYLLTKLSAFVMEDEQRVATACHWIGEELRPPPRRRRRRL